MPSLSSKQIINLLTSTPGRRGHLGQVDAARHHMRQLGAGGVRDSPLSHDQFVRSLQAINQRVGTTQVEEYHHPERDHRVDATRLKMAGERRNGGSPQSYAFAATDLAWLQRLPSDPAAVSYEDAVQLASMASASSAFRDPSGHRLVQSIWKPVKEIHDAKAAALALEQARRPVHDEPAGAVDALADALALEERISPVDARSRARRMIDDAFDQLEDDRSAAIREAQQALTTSASAKSDRTSLSKV